jgi:anti-sigma-K factor RskA
VTNRSHDEYQENIGAYVLGALPELERKVFEKHLATCETCSADVARLTPVTGALARSVPQVEPPPSLKASLMQTVRAEAGARAAAEGRRGREPRRGGLARWFAGLQPRIAAATALAVLAVGVLIGVAANELSQNGPDTRTIAAAKIDRKAMPTGSASLELSHQDRTAKLELTDAPKPPPGREYQLWIQRGKTLERGPTFTVDEDGSVSEPVPGDLRDADAVMVTIERAGGVPAPTGPPIMQFRV